MDNYSTQWPKRDTFAFLHSMLSLIFGCSSRNTLTSLKSFSVMVQHSTLELNWMEHSATGLIPSKIAFIHVNCAVRLVYDQNVIDIIIFQFQCERFQCLYLFFMPLNSNKNACPSRTILSITRLIRSFVIAAKLNSNCFFLFSTTLQMVPNRRNNLNVSYISTYIKIAIIECQLNVVNVILQMNVVYLILTPNGASNMVIAKVLLVRSIFNERVSYSVLLQTVV